MFGFFRKRFEYESGDDQRKDQLKSIGYMQTCLDCNEDYNNDQKIANCPKCGKLFDHEYEHFELQGEIGRLYLNECGACKIIFDNIQETTVVCFKCKGPTNYFGYKTICCGGHGFFDTISHLLKGLLPWS